MPNLLTRAGGNNERCVRGSTPKETDLVPVQVEVEALRFVIPLLAEGGESSGGIDVRSTLLRQSNKWPLELRDAVSP